MIALIRLSRAEYQQPATASSSADVSLIDHAQDPPSPSIWAIVMRSGCGVDAGDLVVAAPISRREPRTKRQRPECLLPIDAVADT